MSETTNDLSTLLGNGRIEPMIETFRVGDEPSEVESWQNLTGDERLAALIDMRSRYFRWKYGTEPRLERLLTIARRA
jgi:hypothetical protein